MVKKIGLWALLSIVLMIQTAAAAKLKNGPWRFEFHATYAVVPFVIEFSQMGGKLKGTLLNGKETIKLGTLKFDKKNKELKIPLGNGQQSLELALNDKGIFEGSHIRHNKDPKVKTKVTGMYGERRRYPDDGKREPPQIKLQGKWEVKLIEEDKEDQGVVLFEQDGSTIHGSILTPTGDYRYFEGFISGFNFEAASFDGVFNYVFRGTVDKDGKLKADIIANYRVKVEGKLNPDAVLPDPYKQTQVTNLKFKFPDISGKAVSLEDEKFKDKAVIVTLFGSWCPNCMDEMNFLVPWYNENKKKNVEIVTLAFERALKKEEALVNLKKVVARKKIPFTVLVAGHTAEDKPMDKIPELKNFISFPTTIFLNKKHEVVKVHAGFTGPSTGEFYEKWKKEFAENVAEISK